MSHLTSLTKELEKARPVRICRWKDCPKEGDWIGTKMRACSQCWWVRYCSKECQRADWPVHKKWCRFLDWSDYAKWITSFEWLFEWAAAQALGGFRGPNLTSTHCVIVRLIRTTDFTSRRVPFFTTFLVYNVSVITIDKLREMAPQTDATWDGHDPRGLGRQIYDTAEEAESARIKREGGMGKALVLIQLYEASGMHCVLRRYKLRDAVTSAYFPGWRSVVRKLANGFFCMHDLVRGMEVTDEQNH